MGNSGFNANRTYPFFLIVPGSIVSTRVFFRYWPEKSGSRENLGFHFH